MAAPAPACQGAASPRGLDRAGRAAYTPGMPPPLLIHFAAGASGAWRIDREDAVAGDGLPAAERLAVLEGPDARAATGAGWSLRGVTSNTRHTNRPEALTASQQGLRRPQATRAALIPIRKTEAWWASA